MLENDNTTWAPSVPEPLARRRPMPETRGGETPDEPEEVAAPRDTIRRNERPGHRRAVNDNHRQRNDGRGKTPVEYRAQDQISEQPEDQTARTDVLRVAGTEQPRPHAAMNVDVRTTRTNSKTLPSSTSPPRMSRGIVLTARC